MIVERQTFSGGSSKRGALLVALLATSLLGATQAGADDPQQPVAGQRKGFLVVVHVPIADGASRRVQRAVDRWLSIQPEDAGRPVVVCEFQPAPKGEVSPGSFGAAFDLATFLTSPSMSRLQTVAYVPGVVTGHAVLAVMACEQIIMTEAAVLGGASDRDQAVMSTHRSAYREIAARRRTIPVPVALGMLDPELRVFRLRMLDGGIRYALGDDLEGLRPQAASEEEVISRGETGRFEGRELREPFGFISHVVSDPKDLAIRLRLPPGSLHQDPSLGGGWRGIVLDVQGRIVSGQVNQLLRGMRDHLADDRNNLVCFRIRSAGGDPTATLRLATEIAALDPGRVRSVAFVDGEARSLAALVAVACDDLVIQQQTVLGGPGDPHVGLAALDELRPVIKQLARQKNRDWSLWAGLVDHRLEVARYSRPETREVRFMCADEWAGIDDSESWKRGDVLTLRKGIDAPKAAELGLVRHVVSGFEEVSERYALEEPLQLVQPPWISEELERLAASPWFARTMIFIAFFALISEASAPGLGVAGFVSGTCFLLFFWAQFFNGNAGWLEVMLFAAGLLCLAVELLVIPGFGVFGVGGGLMLVASLLLASQTFVIPRNPYQLAQLPGSLSTVITGVGGGLVAIFLFARYLEAVPWLSRMILRHQTAAEAELQSIRESLVDWDFLLGQQGLTTTPLTPSGKARFGDHLVQVTTESGAISSSQPITVVDVQGNRVTVEARPADISVPEVFRDSE